MFKAEINADILRGFLNAIGIVTEEILLEVSPDGIRGSITDQANVAAIRVEILKSAFNKYEATPFELPVDILKLSTKLSIVEKDAVVNLEFDEAKHSLIAKIGRIKISMVLLDPASIKKSAKIPSLNYETTVVMSSESLKIPLKAISNAGASVRIGAKDKVFYIESEEATDNTLAEWNVEDLISYTYGLPSLSTYDTIYVEPMLKTLSKNPSITLKTGTDYPLEFSSSFGNGIGSVTYIIAPRVVSED